MAEEKKAPAMPHNLILEDRRTLTVSGAVEIKNCVSDMLSEYLNP